jgi:hypothetical protein
MTNGSGSSGFRLLSRNAPQMEPSPSDLERLLRNSPPQPRAEFVRDLERSLLRSVEPRRRRAWWSSPSRPRSRRLLAGGSLAGAIAAALVVLAIAGVRPFGTSGTSPAQAERTCSTVEQLTRVRRPLLRVDAQGRPHLTYRVEWVPQPVIRCR